MKYSLKNIEERKKFYFRLGYNLKRPRFHQELLKLSKFHFGKYLKFIFYLKKLQNLLKNLMEKKEKIFYIDKSKYNDVLVKFTGYYCLIKGFSRDEAINLLNLIKSRFFLYLTKKKMEFFLKKLIKKTYFNVKNLLNFYKNKTFRKINYKRKVYKLILQHTNNNFFVILTSLKGKVIWYCSAGQVSEFYNIRRKRSHLLVKDMMFRFNRKLRYLKIRYLKIFIRSHISRHIQKVMIFLDNKRIKTKYVIFNKAFPHHFGQRKKKLRRI